MNRMKFICATAAFVAALAGFSSSSSAGWPSAVDVVKKVAPLAGLNSDQVEFTVFAMKEPDCAMTIVSYTLAQDYSLAAFTVALKATKFKSLPQLPKMSAAQCVSYNPIQQTYLFVDGVGNRFLGQGKADYLRGLLENQIAEGKSALEAEIASIPYVGSILTHWDCECKAAFMTDFKSEKMIDQKVGDVIAIGRFVKDGDIPGALERMVTALGPQIACDLGAAWTGVGSIPVVSDIAAEACSGIAGEAVGWVVSGAGATAEALGIIGGEHIPPEEYYKNMFTPEIAKDGYMELADILYGKCYQYFEASNMAASTAKKVCVGMRARYVEESLGKIQWTAFEAEKGGYYKANVEPRAVGAATLDDAAFATVKKETAETCRSYFSQKYPKATAYATAYGGTPIEDICVSFTTYNPSSYHPWDMDKARKNAQVALQNAIVAKNQPFCQAGAARNEIICSSQGIKACFAELSGICAKSSTPLGGMERPCCKLGEGMDSVNASKVEAAAKMAKNAGGPYCSTSDADPLRIACALPQTYDACRKTKTAQGGLPDCPSVAKAANGTAVEICCVQDAGLLDKVPGVTEARKFVEDQNKASAGACAIGGMLEGLSYDPRIVNCRHDILPSCVKAFSACGKTPVGFVPAVCCELSVFSTTPVEEAPFDPATRDPADLALTKKAVDQSQGACSFASGPGGVPDPFKVSCTTELSAKMCLDVLGRPAKTSCAQKTAKNGWVTSPCCLRDLSHLTDRALEEPGRSLGSKTVKDAIAPGKFGDLKLESGDAKKTRAPGGARALGGSTGSGLSVPRAGDGHGLAPSTLGTPRSSRDAERDTDAPRRSLPGQTETEDGGRDREGREDADTQERDGSSSSLPRDFGRR